ncbi:hypothetical protein BS78_03G182500 [Paspalum vaginatum]|nr:hypothetical protein BS78_03G182500 [Paspalum vaginatum]
MGRGTAALLAAAVAVVVAAAALPLPSPARPPPCFHACLDQCVPRDDFWFCQFSCYQRCAAAGSSRAALRDRERLGCEQACALSLCARLRPGTKVMAACRDTCHKSYVLAACALG